MKSCNTCEFRDEYGFCEKLVVGTRRRRVDGTHIKHYYIDEREFGEDGEDIDERSAFSTPPLFKCNLYETIRG